MAKKSTGKGVKTLENGSKAPRAAKVKASATSIAGDIRSLAAEVRDLRSLRTQYNTLLSEHHGLLGALRGLSKELAGGARSAWDKYQNGRNSRLKPGRGVGRARNSKDLDAMTEKLLAVMPGKWSTKNEICQAAGLEVGACAPAFRRLVVGYIKDGKKIPAVLEANGQRGVRGRYRKFQ